MQPFMDGWPWIRRQLVITAFSSSDMNQA